MSEASITNRNIGGIAVQVIGLEELVRRNSQLPVGVLFVLHGRYGNAKEKYLYRIANSVLTEAASHAPEEQDRDLLVVLVDQRNHGDRVVDGKRNEGWNDSGNIKAAANGQADPQSLDNISHLHDMYALYAGTVADVSFLISHLEPLLFPNDERTIDKWMLAGISLGGHGAWHIGAHDPRVSLLVPIIGSPSYLTLLGHRAAGLGIPFAPPYLPNSLKRELERAQPKIDDFRDKDVLVLSGAEDTLVPYDEGGSKAFVDRLKEAGVCRTLDVWVQPGAEHECTEEMIKRTTEFIWAKGLRRLSDEAVANRH
ncbi:alpha/beta-hydrolase [Ceratobasidium sp. AG-I]|nr:alpha/beta-hydrolase [Ceratobasidium sp. AG-I]